MAIHPLAGQPVPAEMLIDVEELELKGTATGCSPIPLTSNS
jgi:hypothetical protein